LYAATVPAHNKTIGALIILFIFPPYILILGLAWRNEAFKGLKEKGRIWFLYYTGSESIYYLYKDWKDKITTSEENKARTAAIFIIEDGPQFIIQCCNSLLIG